LAGAGSGITGLRTVAEQAVVTVRIHRALGRGYTLSGTRIALLTGGTLHRYIGATAHWIAAVRCTQIPIVADKRSTGLAGANSITELSTVTDVSVVTVRVNCAFGCCTIGIILVVGKVAIIVEAESVTVKVLAGRCRC